MDNDSLAHIIASIFVRKTKTTNSQVIMPFESFSDEVKLPLLLEAALEPQEQPALLSFISLEHWVLITTDRLIWKKEKELCALFHQEIKGVDIDKEAWFRQAQGASYKKLTQEIKVFMKSGESHLVNLGESGGNLFAFMDALSWTTYKKKRDAED